MQKYLSVNEVADVLGVHRNTVYRLAGENKIPHIRKDGIGIRFQEEQIKEWLEGKALHSQRLERDLSKPITGIESFPKFIPSVEVYDTIFLKGGKSALGKNSRRWNYGIGAVYFRETKQGQKRWYIDYHDEAKKRIQQVVKNAQSREEAVIALQKAVLDAFSREHDLKTQPKKIKFFEFADLYLEEYAKSNKKSWKADRSYLKSMKEFFGDCYLHEINPLKIEQYKAERLGQKVTHSTVNRCLAILRKMLHLAVEWEFLQEGSIPKIKLFPEKDNLKERILSSEEEAKLLKASAEHLKAILIVALNTGMRLGEILGLKWNQVDLQQRQIRVEKTKSGKIRYVDVNTFLFQELNKLKETSGSNEYVFSHSKAGKPLTTVKTAFKAACRRSGISNLRFHDLRHTFASRLVEKGVDLITVKELLGHSTVKITERYTHLRKGQKARAVELLAVPAERPMESIKINASLLHGCDTESLKKEKDFSSTLLFRSFSVN